MKNIDMFFHKYVKSFIIIVSLFFAINILLFFTIALLPDFETSDTDIPLDKVCNGIKKNGSQIMAEPNIEKLLSEKTAFALLLSDTGDVIWELSKPDNLPSHYTSSEISELSKWYLDGYPTTTCKHPLGLLIIGYEKDSMVKYSISLDRSYFISFLGGCIFIFLVNAFIMVLLFWRNTSKLKKNVIPILMSINALEKGETIVLPEKGELSEICKCLNRASQMLSQKEQSRAEWIAGISHDTRTPLSIMLGYSNELADNGELPDAARRQASIISRHCLRLRDLISDLNLVSKLEYSMQTINQSRINLAELLRLIVGRYYNEGVENKYQFSLDIDEDSFTISIIGNEALLTRMLENLIQNSMRHNPKGCNVIITLSKLSHSYKITISDDGVGMSTDLINKLNMSQVKFITDLGLGEPMHGIGLQLVKQIARIHSADILFMNRHPSGLSVELIFRREV